ncbi:MAG: O-succinylbenzoic acid--CoA ligase [Bacteroidetes bacterium HGW-Bacteroidetes-9]|nr:MAG: O-succinylbenzoic acid--CoA ligase [Bacteroidetes bacterium HGW-Bacteroidetes-9]
MRSIPKELIFNGKYHSSDELRKLATDLALPGKADWEQELGNFLFQWLDDKDFIQVKTSGSTGVPKIIKLSKKSMLTSASMTGSYLGLKENQTALLCLRAGYIAGMMMVVRAMALRMNLITAAPFGSPLDDLPDSQPVDFAAMVPAQVYNSLKTNESKRKLESIGTLIIGGAALSTAVEQLISHLNGKIYATFGMTETITHIALRRLNGRERSEVYTVLPGISIATDERGCLLARVPYLEGTEVITNDLVSIESPSTFRWLGRSDYVINCGGIKLIPEEIERKIAPFISKRFIIASLPDAKSGEVPVLLLESADPINQPEKNQILNAIKPTLSNSEMPRQVLRVSHFSETENGKIDRRGSLKEVRSEL